MQISDASSIARFIPSRVPQQLKVSKATTSPPQGIGVGAQSQTAPKAAFNVLPTAISSPPVPDLGPTLPLDGEQPRVAKSHDDPMKALLADWGKKDSPHDLDGDGTVGIRDMLQLLKQMAEAPVEKETDPLQALLHDWGKADSPYDLNGDGTVGIQDMLQLLANLATDPGAEPDPRHRMPDDSAGETLSQAERLQALLNDWGQTGSKYDLDGDGTVGMTDMLELLKQMAEAPIEKETDPLQALLDDWGKADSPHDLNGDGTVGIQDMLQLLANLATDPGAEPDPRHRMPDDSAGETLSQAERLQALLNDWGQTGSKFDLDGDGTVGMTDMLELLKRMADESAQPPAGDTGATPNQTTLQQLLADWGKTDSRFDLDADGTVGIRDMLLLLAQMAQREPAGRASRPEPNDREHFSRIRSKAAHHHRAAGHDHRAATHHHRAAAHNHREPESSRASRPEQNDREHFNRIRHHAVHYHRAAAHNYARSMLPQIASMDPNEIRESVEDSKIPTEQKPFVLDQIAAWHPRGHHVSVVG